MKIRSSFYMIFLLLISIACREEGPNIETPEFTLNPLGLENTIVNQMVLKNNYLYAMTSKGIYVKNINEHGDFRLLGFEGENVEDAVIFSENDILVSFKDIEFFSEKEPALYRTLDGGDSWTLVENNFGGGEFPEAIHDFEVHPSNPNMIYATGNQVIAKSLDFGVTWELVWGDWQTFANRMRVFINPFAPDEIWAGGQGAIENGFLVYIKGGEEQQIWTDLVPNPTVVKKVVFDNKSPQGIYVGWEGELAKTTDKGATWKTLFDRHEEAHFFMGIGISQNDPNIVFSGKWAKTGDKQPLELYYSMDKGNSWKTKNFPGVDYGGVQDLIVKSESSRERVFVGLDNGGVYEIIMGR